MGLAKGLMHAHQYARAHTHMHMHTGACIDAPTPLSPCHWHPHPPELNAIRQMPTVLRLLPGLTAGAASSRAVSGQPTHSQASDKAQGAARCIARLPLKRAGVLRGFSPLVVWVHKARSDCDHPAGRLCKQQHRLAVMTHNFEHLSGLFLVSGCHPTGACTERAQPQAHWAFACVMRCMQTSLRSCLIKLQDVVAVHP